MFARPSDRRVGSRGWAAVAIAAAACLSACSTSAETPCRYDGRVYPVGQSFPAADGCNGCSCRSDGQVACTLIFCGAPTCALDTTYSYGNDGGMVPFVDQVTLTPPSGYLYTRSPIRTDPVDLSCAPPLPACADTARLDASDIMRDIANADVQAALAAAAPPLYGHDSRPVDGVVFRFTRADGHGFLAGDPCRTTDPQCELPPGIEALVQDLRVLDTQQLADASCAALRAPL
jgi:hypothetical protein